MSEIKFKYGTTVEDKTVNDGDIVMINNTMGSDNSDSADDKLGSVYKGSKIVGTTKADELCLTEDLDILGVTVGNVGDGKEIKSFKKGDSLDDILRQIFTKVTDVTVSNPSASLSTDPSGIIHVGESGNVTLTGTYTDGKFTSTKTWAAQCAPTNMTFKMGGNSIGSSTITNNTATYSTSINTLSETSYSFTCAAAYNASAQTEHTKNDGSASEKSIAADTTPDSSVKTISVKYKWFYSVDGGNSWTGNWTNNLTITNVDFNPVGVIILCPPGYRLSLAKIMNMPMEELPSAESVTLSINNYPLTTYSKYYFKNDSGNSNQFTSITISKS